jgi:hypothetical protein
VHLAGMIFVAIQLSKTSAMKKILLVILFAVGIGLIAFASMKSVTSKNKKEPTEKKSTPPEKKKEGKRSCWMS